MKIQLFDNKNFVTKMIYYDNIIILTYIDKAILQSFLQKKEKCISSTVYRYESNTDWLEFTINKSNAVTAVKQIYSSSYNLNYFKYFSGKNKEC